MHKPMEPRTLESQRHHSMMHNKATGRQLHLDSHTGRFRALAYTSIFGNGMLWSGSAESKGHVN